MKYSKINSFNIKFVILLSKIIKKTYAPNRIEPTWYLWYSDRRIAKRLQSTKVPLRGWCGWGRCVGRGGWVGVGGVLFASKLRSSSQWWEMCLLCNCRYFGHSFDLYTARSQGNDRGGCRGVPRGSPAPAACDGSVFPRSEHDGESHPESLHPVAVGSARGEPNASRNDDVHARTRGGRRSRARAACLVRPA